jgi:hypothetical protein
VRISLSTADRPAAPLKEQVQQELLPHARCPTPHVQQIVPSRMPRAKAIFVDVSQLVMLDPLFSQFAIPDSHECGRVRARESHKDLGEN